LSHEEMVLDLGNSILKHRVERLLPKPLINLRVYHDADMPMAKIEVRPGVVIDFKVSELMDDNVIAHIIMVQ